MFDIHREGHSQRSTPQEIQGTLDWAHTETEAGTGEGISRTALEESVLVKHLVAWAAWTGNSTNHRPN